MKPSYTEADLQAARAILGVVGGSPTHTEVKIAEALAKAGAETARARAAHQDTAERWAIAQKRIAVLEMALRREMDMHVKDGCCGPGAGNSTGLPPGTSDYCELCTAVLAAGPSEKAAETTNG